MFRFRYVFGPTSLEEASHSIPLLPELEQSFSALVGTGELAMDGLRRAMLASDALDDSGFGSLHDPSTGFTSLHDPSLHYDTDSLTLSDTGDLCKLSQMRLQSTSDPILHDRRLHEEDGEFMYTELKTSYGEFSPGSTGDCSLEQDLSDCSSSESGLGSPSSAVQWGEGMGECSVVPISMDPDGPLPPVSDIFNHRLQKEDMTEPFIQRSVPLVFKSDGADSEDDSMEGCTTSRPPDPHLSYADLQPHRHYLPTTVTTATSTTTTTTNNNYHDYTTTTPRVDNNNNNNSRNNNNNRMDNDMEGEEEGGKWLGERGSEEKSGEKTQRKKPGRKKGQVSKVLHLWEFIRDLLSDPDTCPRIISWENEREGVFRVQHSSEVARLWGEKKKNKKIMTYEKLSRSLRYSRKEGYFDALPRDRGYPKKLCFKFGPKSHGWREYTH